MATEYRITDVQGLLTTEVLDKYYSSLADLWITTSVAPYACVKLNEFIIIKVNLPQKFDKAILKNTLKKRDIITTLPSELQPYIKEIKEKLNLTQNDLQKVKQVIESTNTNIQEIINELNNIANKIKQESEQEKFIMKFRKNYSNFNESICDTLLKLDDSLKNEVKETFSHLTGLMNDYQEKL